MLLGKSEGNEESASDLRLQEIIYGEVKEPCRTTWLMHRLENRFDVQILCINEIIKDKRTH